MIVIHNTEFSSNQRLSALFEALTKEKIVGIITKLDAYISPNLKKAATAERAAHIILHDPMLVLVELCKDELKLVKEFIEAGANQYVVRKMRKTHYQLQKYGLVLTYQDFIEEKWHMLMPDEVRAAFAPYIDRVIAYKEEHSKKLTRIDKSILSMRIYHGSLSEDEDK